MKRFWVIFAFALVITGCGLRSEPQEKKQPAAQQAKQQAQPQQAQNNFVALAINLLQQGQVGPAIEALDRAILQDRTNVQAYILLGQTYIHLNQFDRAVDSFRAALTVAPDQGELYYMLALANGLRGRKDLAITNAEKALLLFQQDRDGENFKRALVLLQGLSQE